MTDLAEPSVTSGGVAVLECRPDDLAGPGFRAHVDAVVERHGAVLLRGTAIDGPAAARRIATGLVDEVMVEREAFAPRADHGGGLHSATEWPADSPLCLHHELSYRLDVPSRIVLVCLTAPESGGATVLADGTLMVDLLPPELVRAARETGWRLIRNYGPLAGTDWPAAFGSDDRSAVELACAREDIQWRWTDEGLHTERHRRAVLTHPASGADVWFNQLAFLNNATMDPLVRDFLLEELGPDALPFDTTLGDGSELGAAAVESINAAYDAVAVQEPWQSGDVLVVDNLRMAHGRQPYAGDRDVVVVLGDPVRI